MKKHLLIVLALLITAIAYGQRTEINPNVKWKYVRSQQLELQNESVYQYEFPANKGYDYILSMFYDKSQIITSATIVDLQGKPIASKLEERSQTDLKLDFSVPQSGTYMMIIGYKSKFPEQNLNKEISLSLIERPFVD